MSRVSAIFGTDDDDEILESLYLIANVGVFFFVLASIYDYNSRTQMDSVSSMSR
jgi:hypothetical protein